MSLFRLPRLSSYKAIPPLLFEKYWDQICSRVESLNRGVLQGGTLPSNPSAGDRAFVTDATSAVFNDPYTSGGLNSVPIFYDGATTTWRIG